MPTKFGDLARDEMPERANEVSVADLKRSFAFWRSMRRSHARSVGKTLEPLSAKQIVKQVRDAETLPPLLAAIQLRMLEDFALILESEVDRAEKRLTPKPARGRGRPEIDESDPRILIFRKYERKHPEMRTRSVCTVAFMNERKWFAKGKRVKDPLLAFYRAVLRWKKNL